MHALLAHAYHLVLRVLHVVSLPVWRPPAACLAVAVLGRGLPVALPIALPVALPGRTPSDAGSLRAGRAGLAPLVTGLAVLVGWLVLAPPLNWPPTPVARLPGLAAIVLADAMLRAQGRSPWLLPPAVAAAASWWLRGTPPGVSGIAACLPVALVLAAILPVARTLADRAFAEGRGRWTTVAASATLSASLAVAGAAPHWGIAASVPALAALGAPRAAGAMGILAGMVVMAAAAALVASDRGRLLPVDLACLTPLLPWLVVPRLAPRIGRHGTALAVCLAACLAASAGVALIVLAKIGLNAR